MYGLSKNTLKKLNTVFEQNSKINQVVLFGSRAKGNYEEYSDIDLAVKGSNFNYSYIIKIFGEIENLMLPYNTDLINYHNITEPALKEHIDRVGKNIYEKKS